MVEMETTAWILAEDIMVEDIIGADITEEEDIIGVVDIMEEDIQEEAEEDIIEVEEDAVEAEEDVAVAEDLDVLY